MKDFISLIVSCILGTCSPAAQSPSYSDPVAELAGLDTYAGELGQNVAEAIEGDNLSGNYLASQFAQRHHDWNNAKSFLTPVVAADPENSQVLNKAMVLAMGSGDAQLAMSLAKQLHELDGNDAVLASLFIALEALYKQDYEGAMTYIKSMPSGSLADFITPLLQSWANAAQGKYDVSGLHKNTIHLHHAILISDFMDKKDQIRPLLEQSLGAQGLSLHDLERIADTYAYIGEKDIARDLLQKLFDEWPENRPLAPKIEALQNGDGENAFSRVSNPQYGIASALYDMARLLFQEQSDDSARVFANMALLLNPDMTDVHLLLGYITARNDQYDEAIAYYQRVTPDNPRYLESRRMAADLMESTGRIDDALSELTAVYDTHKDLESLIQIGDIHRRAENFEQAAKTYEHAAQILGEPTPREYWQIHYVLGMSYERLGEWEKAEKQLLTALDYQPEHPLILNYLGYSWADQGINLQKSLELIRKAVALQPSDGYITDSLGWVLYRMGRYEEAIPHLEKAVELLPYDPIINDHLGDVYWQVGRKLEARFQWVRSKNHSEDEELSAEITRKLSEGLERVDVVKEAHSKTGETDTDVLQP